MHASEEVAVSGDSVQARVGVSRDGVRRLGGKRSLLRAVVCRGEALLHQEEEQTNKKARQQGLAEDENLVLMIS